MSTSSDETTRELSTVDSNVVSLVSKAELDQQITTALANPRSVKKFRAKCLELATLTEQIADECIFALPRKDGAQTKMIEGPSVRLAEIVAHSWGNCRAAARVVDEGREFITAQGVFHDLETNTCITYEVRRRITGKYGRYNADMISTTGNAACAIALRNAVFKGVPKAFWNDIYEAARKVAMGDAKTLANRRSEAMSYFQKLGAPADKVFATLGVAGIEDVTLEHLATLAGIKNAVKDGELTIEDAFDTKPPADKPTSRAQQAKDALKGGNGPKFDEATARAALGEAKDIAGLEATWKAITDDYIATARSRPIELDGAFNDRRESLNQAGGK